MKKCLIKLIPVIDCLAVPIVFGGALIMKAVRRVRVDRLPRCMRVFNRLGIFPIQDHYYEPLFKSDRLKKSLREDRDISAIDWNCDEQLKLLEGFNYNEELEKFPRNQTHDLQFYYNNPSFLSGDAEILYSMVRYFKPKRVFEVGSGYSTLLLASALKKNAEETKVNTEHICIEPYEMPWLETLDVKVIRRVVEEIDEEFFRQLERNDILFIDSSHMIRPQGDVLFEILETLPKLKPGVLIHFHDIFSPKDYLDEWIKKEIRFWNEQYLLEAFLSFNREFKIVCAVNYLKHHFPEKLASKCPVLGTEISKREPGSFWIQRV